MLNPRRTFLGKVFISEIVGMHFRFQSKDSYEDQYFALLPGTELTVRHEPKNRFDKNACGVFVEGRKLGYLPAFVASLVVKRLRRGRQFRFFIFDPSNHYRHLEGLPTTYLLGIEQDYFQKKPVRKPK